MWLPYKGSPSLLNAVKAVVASCRENTAFMCDTTCVLIPAWSSLVQLDLFLSTEGNNVSTQLRNVPTLTPEYWDLDSAAEHLNLVQVRLPTMSRRHLSNRCGW
jgi:hypothetical protein